MIRNRLLSSNAKFASIALVCGMMATAAGADQISLKSADGTLNIVGEFIEFKDGNYTVKTALGDLRISASRVRCEGAACPEFSSERADVTIVGSDAIAIGMMPLLMTGYASHLDAEAQITNTATQGQALASLVADGGFGDDLGTFMVSANSSEQAFEGLFANEAQIGMASRRILPAEAKRLRANGAGNMVSPDQERVVAVDSLVVVTHPSNPVGEITLDNLRDIFTGKITNWNELGGENAPIKVVARAEGSSAHNFFMERVFEGNSPATPGNFDIGADDQETAAKVNGDPHAIGYVGLAFQRGAKPMTLVNECNIPTSPDAFSAKTEEYSLNRRMYLYNRSDNIDERTRDFLEFAISENADGVIAKSGFIDLGIDRRSQKLSDERKKSLLNSTADAFEAGVMQEMFTVMNDSDRLSTTFRFRTGSSRMDEKAKADLKRLVNYLADVPEGTEITLVGFTDDVGAFQANQRLSRDRARQVRDVLVEAAGEQAQNLVFKTEGFGEIAPAACNISQAGRAINRRVEVWISNG